MKVYSTCMLMLNAHMNLILQTVPCAWVCGPFRAYVWFFRQEGTWTYRRPLSGNTLLCADSGQLSHVTHGIPVGQFLRLHSICSEEGDFQHKKEELYNRFYAQGYKSNVLRRAIDIAEVTLRVKLLEKKNVSLIYPTFLSSLSPIAGNIVRSGSGNKDQEDYGTQHTDFIRRWMLCKNIFKGFKTVSWRSPFLANSLSPSDYSSCTRSRTWLDFIGTFKCGAMNCPCCPRLIQCDHFRSAANHRTFKIKKKTFIHCNTKNVIYLVTCRTCVIQ